MVAGLHASLGMRNFIVITLVSSLAACAQLEEESAVESTAEIVIDPACQSSSLKLYDRPSYQGVKLCLKYPGTIDLNTICRVSLDGVCLGYWGHNVRSARAGVAPARLIIAPVDAGTLAVSLDPWESISSGISPEVNQARLLITSVNVPVSP